MSKIKEVKWKGKWYPVMGMFNQHLGLGDRGFYIQNSSGGLYSISENSLDALKYDGGKIITI